MPPRNVKQVQSFVGMLNHYKAMIPHHSHLLTPFTALTKKNVKFEWTTVNINKPSTHLPTSPFPSKSTERTNRIFKDTGLYTIVTPSTSPLPTPLERRHKGIHESSWVNVLFQCHFGCCQVRIKMCLGPI
jgi:hypothetical protein